MIRRLREGEWPSFALRLAAVLGGAVFVLIDPSASIADVGFWARGSPLPSLIILFLLAAVGALAVLFPQRHRLARWLPGAALALDLTLVALLVRVTAREDSVFYLYFPLVLASSPAASGIVQGVAMGWMASIVFAFAAGWSADRTALLSSTMLLPLFGAVVGIAHARYSRRLDATAREAQVAQARVESLERTRSALSGMAPLELDDRIGRVLDGMVGLVKSDIAATALLDDDGVPTVRGVRNLEPWAWEGRRLAPDSGVVGRLLVEGRAILTPDAPRDPDWAEVLDGVDVHAAVAVPFKVQDRVIGLAVLGRRNGDAFGSSDVDLLRILADDAAVALHDGRVQEELRALLYSTVNTLAAALEAKDPYTRGHSQRVASNSVAIAVEMGLGHQEVEHIRLASLLHDIGKIGTPEHILRKRGPLTDEERAIINQHAERGAAILREMRPFRPLVDLVLHHQESFDGSGYPYGLSGDEIPLGARIIRVADTFDALTSDRPYRRGKPLAEAIAELRAMVGNILDPQIVDIFERVLATKPPFEVQLRMWRERS